jgi:hypothetical protein
MFDPLAIRFGFFDGGVPEREFKSEKLNYS